MSSACLQFKNVINGLSPVTNPLTEREKLRVRGIKDIWYTWQWETKTMDNTWTWNSSVKGGKSWQEKASTVIKSRAAPNINGLDALSCRLLCLIACKVLYIQTYPSWTLFIGMYYKLPLTNNFICRSWAVASCWNLQKASLGVIRKRKPLENRTYLEDAFGFLKWFNGKFAPGNNYLHILSWCVKTAELISRPSGPIGKQSNV